MFVYIWFRFKVFAKVHGWGRKFLGIIHIHNSRNIFLASFDFQRKNIICKVIEISYFLFYAKLFSTKKIVFCLKFQKFCMYRSWIYFHLKCGTAWREVKRKIKDYAAFLFKTSRFISKIFTSPMSIVSKRKFIQEKRKWPSELAR